MDFVSFARDHGIVIDATPPLGVWRRYKTLDKHSKRNGAVKYCGDYGFVQNWATSSEVAVWKANGSSVPAAGHDAAIRAQRQQEARRRVRASIAMREHYHALPVLREGHPYLLRKGLSMVGCGHLRVDGELLVIPMYVDDHLVSFQTIAPDGTKKYRAGCPSRSAMYPLTRKHAVVTCFAEGFATGLALYQAVPNSSVIVCFDAGNMARVAEHVKPRGLCVVAADNDYETEARTGKNPGLIAGRAAAEAIGCGVTWPSKIAGTDFADLLAERGERGPAEIRMQVMRYARMRSG